MNCLEFEAALSELLDGTIAAGPHGLAVRHAAACESCRELVLPMGAALRPVAVRPPRSLRAGVLARTSRPAWSFRWTETWRCWVLRPRFASEAAYIGVVALAVACATRHPGGASTRTARAGAVLSEIGNEAGIFLNRATSLWEKERP